MFEDHVKKIIFEDYYEDDGEEQHHLLFLDNDSNYWDILRILRLIIIWHDALR